MSHSTHYLLTSSKSYYKPSLQKSSFDLDDFRETYDSLPKQSNINIESPDEPSRYGGTHSLCVYIFCLSCLFTLFFSFTGLFCSILMLAVEPKWLQSKYLFLMLEFTRFITSKETMKVGKNSHLEFYCLQCSENCHPIHFDEVIIIFDFFFFCRGIHSVSVVSSF